MFKQNKPHPLAVLCQHPSYGNAELIIWEVINDGSLYFCGNAELIIWEVINDWSLCFCGNAELIIAEVINDWSLYFCGNAELSFIQSKRQNFSC